MTQKKQHWRAIAGKEFLIGEEFAGKDVTLTIKSVQREQVQNQQGKENKIVARFEESDRAIILNVTNCKAITKVLGSGYIQDWVGHKITFTSVKGTFFGEEQEVIRVKQDYSSIKPIK